MAFNKITAGNNPPEDINVIIEIPALGSPIKYEIDKETDSVWVDRFMATTMFYPANYGYVNNTLANDGDPVDVLVIAPHALQVGSVIRCRPIGILKMTDDGGGDAKVIAVPHDKLTQIYKNVRKVEDIPLIKEQIQHFFEQYKVLEADKWVRIDGWFGIEEANSEIIAGIKRFN